jgi:predicted phosphodiesterase
MPFIIVMLLGITGFRSELIGSELPSDRFNFVQISDVHIGDGDHLVRLQKAVDQINKSSIKIDFVVITGDTVHDSSDQKAIDAFNSCIKTIQVPVYILPGNHDMVTDASEKKPIHAAAGSMFQTVERNGVVLILCSSLPLAENFTLPGYDPIKSLQTSISQAGKKPIIVFDHIPPCDDFYNNEMHSPWDPGHEKEFQQWRQLLSNDRIKGVITGHFHRDEFYWIKRTPVFVCESIAGFWGRQGAYRIYHYEQGSLSYRTQYIQ